MPSLLEGLGSLHQSRFKHIHEIADINRAIYYYNRALLLAPDDQATRPNRLSQLGDSHQLRFERYGDLADVNRAIECLEQVVRFAPVIHVGMPGWLGTLGNFYLSRFGCNGELADVEKAIACQKQAVVQTPDNDANKPGWLCNLAVSHMHLFERHGKRADLDNAIAARSRALGLTPHGHMGRPSQLNQLGNLYRERFNRYGEHTDINRSIECLQQAVELTPDDHADKSGFLHNLGISYWDLFERSGELADVNRAIECQTKALLHTPSDVAMPARLNNLGNSYRGRFKRQGELVDIEKSIELLSQAVRLTRDDDNDKPSRLSNLGVSYLRRFERYGELADLDMTIKYQDQAVLLTHDSDPARPGYLGNLGNAWSYRFQHLKQSLDIEKGIECLSEALRLTPDDHISKPGHLTNLGRLLQERFKSNGKLADIDRSIEYCVQAAQLAPDTGISAAVLHVLGAAYLCRFEHQGELTDVNKAIEYHSQAVQLTPDGHPEQAGHLARLGEALTIRDAHDQNSSDILEIVTTYKQAAQCVTGNPSILLASAQRWARGCIWIGTSPQLAFERVVELMPQMIWLGSNIEQRYSRLRELGNLALEAVSWAISAQVYDRALEWLEQGRAVVWNQILQLRTPFDDLHVAHPDLANRLKEVARELEHVGSRPEAAPISLNDVSNLQAEAEHHRRLATEWGELLGQARQIRGFENFLRPLKANMLLRAAKRGPLIVINIYQLRCDALIIQPNNDKITHIPLEGFTSEEAAELHTRLISLVGQRGGRAGGFRRLKTVKSDEELMKGMLATLWSDIVQPIFQFLGYSHKISVEDAEVPHVTWCTTGALSFLPLHAAGDYDGLHANAFDLAVASYTPTISTLLGQASTMEPCSGILAIGQKYTAGFSDLPNTDQELAAIKELAKGTRYLQLNDHKATPNNVLSAMSQYDWVHLACHATQNKENPVQSAFHLHEGNLTLSSISKESFKNKGLAFLSACQTATGDENLPDEALHLAAGMLMAGYSSVIATMWAIHDEDAPEVARQVYADVLKDGRIEGTSRALHRAVAGLRRKVGESSFARWVPFVHIGL